MSSWLVYLCPSWFWRCPTVTLGGATCHQVLACPSQEYWPDGRVILSGTLIVSGMAHANSRELADIMMFVFSPFLPPLSTDVDFLSKSYGENIYSYPIPTWHHVVGRELHLVCRYFLWHIPNWHHVVGGELHFVCRSFLFRSGDLQILGGGWAI